MSDHSPERTALFIDGSNLHAASRLLGFDIDYRALLDHVRSQCRLLRAYYYTAVLDTDEHNPIRPLVDWLAYNGYRVVTKPAREFTDSNTGFRRIKGNCDIELAVDMLELAPHLDHAVLFSGDGDFRRVVEAVQAKGVKVTVCSTLRVQPPICSDDLRRQADAFIDLADLASEITRRPSDARPRNNPGPPPPRPAPTRATPAEPFAEETEPSTGE
ncbi:MAG: hypothetical protein JWO26_1782 [Rhodospirillales bacterium]|nr:hypothetical protein [Rhodospirillales bacterium]